MAVKAALWAYSGIQDSVLDLILDQKRNISKVGTGTTMDGNTARGICQAHIGCARGASQAARLGNLWVAVKHTPSRLCPRKFKAECLEIVQLYKELVWYLGVSFPALSTSGLTTSICIWQRSQTLFALATALRSAWRPLIRPSGILNWIMRDSFLTNVLKQLLDLLDPVILAKQLEWNYFTFEDWPAFPKEVLALAEDPKVPEAPKHLLNLWKSINLCL